MILLKRNNAGKLTVSMSQVYCPTTVIANGDLQEEADHTPLTKTPQGETQT